MDRVRQILFQLCDSKGCVRRPLVDGISQRFNLIRKGFKGRVGILNRDCYSIPVVQDFLCFVYRRFPVKPVRGEPPTGRSKDRVPKGGVPLTRPSTNDQSILVEYFVEQSVDRWVVPLQLVDGVLQIWRKVVAVDFDDRTPAMRDGHRTSCMVGTRNDVGLDSCLGQGGLEETVEVCRHDHFDETTRNQARYGVVSFRGQFPPFSPFLLCRFEVRLQEVAAIDWGRSQLGKKSRVVGITVSMTSIPGDGIVSRILPSQNGKAPDEIKCHMPAGRDSGAGAYPRAEQKCKGLGASVNAGRERNH